MEGWGAEQNSSFKPYSIEVHFSTGVAHSFRFQFILSAACIEGWKHAAGVPRGAAREDRRVVLCIHNGVPGVHEEHQALRERGVEVQDPQGEPALSGTTSFQTEGRVHSHCSHLQYTS